MYNITMRTINLHYHKFKVGNKVKMIKPYSNGIVKLNIGDLGIIKSISIEHLPDIGLFDLRILHLDFIKYKISMGDDVAKEFMDVVKI